jgi:hypothetical protein
VFPPSNAIFAGIGVLLQVSIFVDSCLWSLITHTSLKAIKDDHVGHGALVDLFGRIEYFFKRLETYIEIQPTVAMTDIIVKIMVEVLSILGIVTKEIKQGRNSMPLPAYNSSKIRLSFREISQDASRMDGH